MRNALVALTAAVWVSSALAKDYPFSAIADLPERRFIGVDEHGYPHIADTDKPEVARIATSAQSPKALRELAIWGLAISGYSPQSAESLLRLATDRTLDSGSRSHAAMGLRNFTTALPPDKKEECRASLRATMKAEGLSAVDEITRVLIAWGDAPWLAEHFRDDLADHPLEIEIVEMLPAATGTSRLLEIYRMTPRENSPESYSRRSAIGRALVRYQDKRGIDLLDTLLDAEKVPTLPDGAPSHQYRHNVFAVIQRALGKKFDYEHLNYDSSIDEAIVPFRRWWFEERYRFEFTKQ